MGNLIIGSILTVAVAAVILSMIRNKLKGKSSCGCGCASCGMAGACHGHKHGITTTLSISGMMCGMCESHINDAIRNNFVVKSVKSNHKNGISQIVSEKPLDEAKLFEVIKNTGYGLNKITFK